MSPPCGSLPVFFWVLGRAALTPCLSCMAYCRRVHLQIVWGGALGDCHDCGSVWGEGSESGQWHCLASEGLPGRKLSQGTHPAPVSSLFPRMPLVPSSCGSGAESQRGWVCGSSKFVWVLQEESPDNPAVSSATSTPTCLYSQKWWGLILALERWAAGCSGGTSSNFYRPHVDVGLPVLPPLPTTPMAPHLSAPPTHLDKCGFFKSLAVRLPYSSIFWQFWVVSVL